jgi:hypothetical protein
MVYYNTETDSYEIYDWKRSKEIIYDTPYAKSAITPCISHFPDTNYWHYSLQLNTYKKILEEKYDIAISAMYLLFLHPNYDAYQRIEVKHHPKEMCNLFALRKKEIVHKTNI